MKFDMIAFLCGIVLMAMANAISLGFLPCRTAAVIFFIITLLAVAAGAYLIGRRNARKAANLKAYHEGIRKGMEIGRAETQSEIQRFLED